MQNPFTKPVRSSSNARQSLRKLVATLSAKASRNSVSEEQPKQMADRHRDGMSLHNARGRKYLNTAERRRFLKALDGVSPHVRLFCLVLMWGGCRLSEALSLSSASFDIESGLVEFETLKRRQRWLIRQVPLPTDVLDELNRVFDLVRTQHDPARANNRLWPWSRSTAWRHVKAVMRAAEIHGSSAMPKGLRHTFGVAAFHSVPPHLVQRWLGHASLRTTAIYGDVVGPEERTFAAKIWKDW